ncbi:DUF1176 domain-containing protein [Sphingomonas gilva]|uniref:DUF1176 domain-containing protein n=1 Tax=Sphingomonas gilva TaxID=2305907 RepID=A0A396RTJ9_9SPHN|nr:DUF1176 domain-containing protein [Sphingomonas gilva]RHW18722.1 DUF1176 domain-containing protein [Sphingomonas gilva]
MMMKLSALPLLALAAACGQNEPANGSAAEVANAAGPAVNAVVPASGPVDDGAVPSVAEIETFRDWSVACDNGKTCEAVSLAPGMANLQDVGMIVRRPAGADGAVSISLRSPSDQAGEVDLVVEGKRIATGTWDGDGMVLLDRDASADVAAAIVDAPSLHLRSGGTDFATISLAGASAALRYMDAQQGRANTPTALVAKGNQPFTAAPPPLPTVVAAPIARGDAASPPAALIAEMRRVSECPADDFGPATEQAHKLSDRDTLVLISCGSGAYNAIAAPFVVTDGKARPAPFDEGYSFGEPGTETRIVNGGWDAETGRLSSAARGRGLGDCGEAREWVWDGARFRLVIAETEGNCRGAVKWLRTWTARVERAAG